MIKKIETAEEAVKLFNERYFWGRSHWAILKMEGMDWIVEDGQDIAFQWPDYLSLVNGWTGYYTQQEELLNRRSAALIDKLMLIVGGDYCPAHCGDNTPPFEEFCQILEDQCPICNVLTITSLKDRVSDLEDMLSLEDK
jgi:hypothetical protein